MEVLLSIISFFLLIALIVKVNGIRDRLTRIFRKKSIVDMLNC